MSRRVFVSVSAVVVAVVAFVLAAVAFATFGIALLQPHRFEHPFWPAIFFAFVSLCCGQLAWAVGSQSVVWLSDTHLHRPLRRPVALTGIRGIVRTHRLYPQFLQHSGRLLGTSRSRTLFNVLPTMTERHSVDLLRALSQRLGVAFHSEEVEAIRREIDRLRGGL